MDTEDGWNRSKFGPIEKFLMYYENIEREKARERGRVKEGQGGSSFVKEGQGASRRVKEPIEACLGNYHIASLFTRQQMKELSDWLVLEQLVSIFVYCFGSFAVPPGGQPRQESLWKLEVTGLTLTRRKKGSGSNKRKLKRYFLTRLNPAIPFI